MLDIFGPVLLFRFIKGLCLPMPKLEVELALSNTMRATYHYVVHHPESCGTHTTSLFPRCFRVFSCVLARQVVGPISFGLPSLASRSLCLDGCAAHRSNNSLEPRPTWDFDSGFYRPCAWFSLGAVIPLLQKSSEYHGDIVDPPQGCSISSG